jgi:acetoin utilization deacetylase AcuC-like enzyme
MNIKHLFQPAVKLVFSFDYYIGISTSNAYQSFDIMKYKKIRDRLIKEKVIRRRHILAPEMLSYEDMRLVHSASYLKQIQDPLTVARYLRIGQVEPWDSYILEFFRTVSGGTLLAAEQALKNNCIAFNLGGGFHHAQPEQAAGFCLLNDVAIAIEKTRRKYKLENIMIIDLDYHQGDGNLLFYKKDPKVFTFSMHATKWMETETEGNLDILIPHQISGTEYMNLLREKLMPVFESFNPQLVFYIAGSDPYKNDTLCDLNLTREEMLERNLYILDLVRARKIPLVVVAGGGYGSESWKIYYDFIASTLKGPIR